MLIPHALKSICSYRPVFLLSPIRERHTLVKVNVGSAVEPDGAGVPLHNPISCVCHRLRPPTNVGSTSLSGSAGTASTTDSVNVRAICSLSGGEGSSSPLYSRLWMYFRIFPPC